MNTNHDLNKQLPNELNVILKERKVLQHVRNAGITKTLGWSDGATFIPVDFSLLSSRKSQINGISNIDKRSSGDKRRVNALQTAPEQIPDMIHRALSSGIDVAYVLMDCWFTPPPLVKNIQEQGLDVIGMVKSLKQ